MRANSKGRARPSQGRPAPADHDEHHTDGADELGPLFSQRTETRDVQTIAVEVDATKPAPKRGSQCANILAYLSRPDRPRLDQLTATRLGFGVRLPARVKDLRKRGHDIRIDESYAGPMAHYYLAGE
jgi:hypothetical protein